VSGWNTPFFDIPYLVNRISNVLGPNDAKRLSPWKLLNSRIAKYKGREIPTIDLLGIATLDYMDLYRKFAPVPNQESHKLDHIAYVELEERKLSYEEYGNLNELYEKNYQRYIEYNIRDVELVQKLEDKMGLISLAIDLAYDAKINYVDVFYEGRMWDTIIYNDLLAKNIILPPKRSNTKTGQIAGGHVRPPYVGMHNWVVSLDINALYPSLIMQFNISPETLLPDVFRTVSVDKLLEKKVELPPLKTNKMTMAGNGHCFRTDKQGFLPQLIQRIYETRKEAKKKMIENQKELERVNAEIIRRGI
jgi:DNA polymerase elongation subunit (family B)